jgi:hypothetical protein
MTSSVKPSSFKVLPVVWAMLVVIDVACEEESRVRFDAAFSCSLWARMRRASALFWHSTLRAFAAATRAAFALAFAFALTFAFAFAMHGSGTGCRRCSRIGLSIGGGFHVAAAVGMETASAAAMSVTSVFFMVFGSDRVVSVTCP